MFPKKIIVVLDEFLLKIFVLGQDLFFLGGGMIFKCTKLYTSLMVGKLRDMCFIRFAHAHYISAHTGISC